MVKHLQEQLTELQGAKDALAISRTREDALQQQVSCWYWLNCAVCSFSFLSIIFNI